MGYKGDMKDDLNHEAPMTESQRMLQRYYLLPPLPDGKGRKPKVTDKEVEVVSLAVTSSLKR